MTYFMKSRRRVGRWDSIVSKWFRLSDYHASSCLVMFILPDLLPPSKIPIIIISLYIFQEIGEVFALIRHKSFPNSSFCLPYITITSSASSILSISESVTQGRRSTFQFRAEEAGMGSFNSSSDRNVRKRVGRHL